MTAVSGTIILASASPRRRLLLENAGVGFSVVAPDGVKERSGGFSVSFDALTNAYLKAEAVSCANPDSLVIGADTVIDLDGILLGKPSSEEEARSMLLRLSGKRHSVITGVAILRKKDCVAIRFADVSSVFMRNFSERDADCYMKLVNVMDKAGAYAAQEHGDAIIERVEGSMENVIGLPVARILDALRFNGLLEGADGHA